MRTEHAVLIHSEFTQQRLERQRKRQSLKYTFGKW